MVNQFEQELRARLTAAGTSPGAFGRLERLAAQVARQQKRLRPRMNGAGLLVFAGDHGIAALGILSKDAGRTRPRARAMARGEEIVARLAAQTGIRLELIDAAMEGVPDAGPGHHIRPGTVSFADGPAMTEAERNLALQTGETIAAQSPHDCLGIAEIGRGVSASASLLVHRITGTPLDSVISRGEGLDAEGLFRKHRVLTQASDRVPRGASVTDLLTEFGGLETAMMVGAMIGAAKAQKLVLVDGYASCVAALIAAQLVPETRAAMVFSHLTRAPGHRVALEALAAQPLLQLDVDMGEGAGVVLAWPVVRSALALLNGD